MTDERPHRSLSRIDAAMARIEAAIETLDTRETPVPADGAASIGLLERHARLRTGAVEALARLDRLIAARTG